MQISTIPVGLGQKSAAVELSNIARPNNVITTIPVEAYVATLDDDMPKVSSEEEINNILGTGGNVKLGGDIKLSMPIELKEGKSSIDLNGHNIVVEEPFVRDPESPESTYAVGIWNEGADTVIEGEGEIKACDAKFSLAVWAKNGKVTINGGTFKNGGDSCDLIYASGNGIIEINGGTFIANGPASGTAPGTRNPYVALNVRDQDFRAGTANIIVKGGRFYKFNPADNVSETAHTNFVAEGYESVQDGDWWEVRAIEE